MNSLAKNLPRREKKENVENDDLAPIESRNLDAVPDVLSLTLTQATEILVIVLGMTAFAYFGRAFVLPVMMAWVGSMALKPLVNWLRRRHLPAPLAAGVVVGTVVVAAFCGTYYLGQPAVAWIKSSPQAIQQLRDKYESALRHLAPVAPEPSPAKTTGTNTVQTDPKPSAPAPTPPMADSHIVSTVFNWTGSALAGIGEAIALLFLLLASGDLFMQKVVHVMPTLTDKKRATEICHEIQKSISRYLFSIGVINLCLGTLIGTCLYFLGMPGAWMWGAIAAVANFIPYFGPVLGMSAIAVAGLLAFNNVGQGLAPAGVYLAVHLVEANLVTPYALGRRFTLSPVVIFVFLMFCVWLWGVIGAFLAVPILVSIKVICDRVKIVSPLGEFLSL